MHSIFLKNQSKYFIKSTKMNSSLSKKQRQISSPDEEKKKGRVNTSSRDEILK